MQLRLTEQVGNNQQPLKKYSVYSLADVSRYIKTRFRKSRQYLVYDDFEVLEFVVLCDDFDVLDCVREIVERERDM